MAQGTSVTRPQSSPLTKLASRPKNSPNGTDAADHVDQPPQRDAAPAGEQHHRQNGAEEAAVERHAAVPHREDLQRVGEEHRQIVEQHVADAAAER